MKSFKLIIGLFFISHLLFSQSDENAKTLLDKVSAKTKEYENIFLEFTNSIENQNQGLEKKITKGSLFIKNDKYKIVFLGNEQLFDGEKIYRIINNDLAVEIYNPEDLEEEGLSPNDILTLYETGYEFKMGKLETFNQKTIQTIFLYPEKIEEPFKYIELGIDLNKHQITHFIQFGKNGTNTEYYINSFKTNLTDIDSLLIFNPLKYEKFEIIDLSE